MGLSLHNRMKLRKIVEETIRESLGRTDEAGIAFGWMDVIEKLKGARTSVKRLAEATPDLDMSQLLSVLDIVVRLAIDTSNKVKIQRANPL